jgi:ABC-type multidrug transport system fused ATPase/permease subunit
MVLTPQQLTLAIVAIVLIALIAIVAAVITGRRRSQRMQEHYGSEYDRTLSSAGNRRAAEAELLERERRREKMDIRPLPAGLRENYVAQWKTIQANFVDEPRKAVEDANNLLQQVMEARGYPTRDLAGRADDLSVDYGPIVNDYRTANAIAATSQAGDVSTEDMRSALLLYRSLFDALLESGRADTTADDRAQLTRQVS